MHLQREYCFLYLLLFSVSPFTNSASDVFRNNACYILTYFHSFCMYAKSFQTLIFKDILSMVFILSSLNISSYLYLTTNNVTESY